MKMKDLDSMFIEQIIRLPFFHSLETSKGSSGTLYWKITFKCNKLLSNGMWGLLDYEYDTEFIVKYKLKEFKTELSKC